MITQTIKQWLNRLFAWWPWRRASATSSVRTADTAIRGVTQEQMWRTTVDGPIPQPGNMSVAIEQEMDDFTPDTSSESCAERITQYSPSTGTLTPSLFPTESVQSKKTEKSSSTTFEQKIAFLQYLVRRGIVNEGFVDGGEPDQYRRKE